MNAPNGPALSCVGQTFLSAGRRRFPAARCTGAVNSRDWKVPATGRLESLPYARQPLDTSRHGGQPAELLRKTNEVLFAA